MLKYFCAFNSNFLNLIFSSYFLIHYVGISIILHTHVEMKKCKFFAKKKKTTRTTCDHSGHKKSCQYKTRTKFVWTWPLGPNATIRAICSCCWQQKSCHFYDKSLRILYQQLLNCRFLSMWQKVCKKYYEKKTKKI